MNNVILRISDLSKSYPSRGGEVKAIESVTFDVRSGEFVALVGPSGCGKTTLMMCVAGLTPLTAGEVHLRANLISEPPEGLALVFQDYSRSLFPWLTVASNIEVPLRGRLPKSEIRQRRQRALEAVELADADSLYPWQLSGGMQQRVAIARGLAMNPEVLLMDEPLRLGRRPDPGNARRPSAPGLAGVRIDHPVRHPRHRRSRLSVGPDRGADPGAFDDQG